MPRQDEHEGNAQANIVNKDKRPHRAPPGLVPERLNKLRFRCLRCGTLSPMPWLEKMPKALAPKAEQGGHWVPAVIPVPCPAPGCGAVMAAQVPRKEVEGNWTLFGDESGRQIVPAKRFGRSPLHFFSMNLVGLHATLHARVQAEIRELKRVVRPRADPDSWAHHFSRIWSERKDEGEHNLESKAAKVAYARRFAGMIAGARPHLVSFTFSSCIVDDEPALHSVRVNTQKEEIFSFALVSSLEQMRENKKGVRWIFDNVADATGAAPTEGWAKEVFLGWQYTPLLHWLGSGSAVLEPLFEKPGSHFLSEIADFIAFWVGREYFSHLTDAKCECPTSLTGRGFYQFALADGSFDGKWAAGIPIEAMVPLPN